MPKSEVLIPLDLLLDLWRYGNLAPIEGVMYGKSHRDRLAEADRFIGAAYADEDAPNPFLTPIDDPRMQKAIAETAALWETEANK